MCRMLGVMCNDESLLACAVHAVRDSLQLKAEAGHDGVGMGYFQADEPLLKKRPAEKAKVDWDSLFQGVHATTALAHVRRGTVGGWHEANTHPFRFRRWLFAQLGHLPRVEANRAKVLSELPPFLARNVRGETDSEVAFHMFLHLLFRDGTLNDLTLAPERLAAYLRELGQAIDGQTAFALCATNGQIMATVHRGLAMHYSLREGIPECDLHPDDDPQQQHGRFKGVMLGAEMVDPGHQWREVPDGSLITVSRELELKVHQL
ncbi:MAG TPA: class II glutamine amidotransferase [Myxococcota bacterium]|nr:class II glutamine amidotransferase [Myxococcota bacterium]HRY96406.1 class II glutamine amidotransferase [Myxococcota bacterium]